MFKNAIFCLLAFLFSISSLFACHSSTINSVNIVDNGNGSKTYTINVSINVGSQDGYGYGIALLFSNASGTPVTITNIGTASITGSNATNLYANTGADIGSDFPGGVSNDFFLARYANRNDVITYETQDNSFGAGTINYNNKTIVVTVSGCVQTITLDADFRSLGTSTVNPQCLKTYSTAAFITTNTSCFGGTNGSLTISVTGGTAPFTYNWGNNVTTQSRTGLAAGVYTATVTDASNCLSIISSTLTQPTAVTLTNTNQNSSCGQSNGSIVVTASGGAPAYTYNWGNNVTTQNRTGLTVGNYMVSVTDANGCVQSLTTTISSIPPATITPTSTNVTCFGGTNGSLSISVTGGTAPFTYNWGNNVTTQSRTGLAAGVYTATITDASNCLSIISSTLTQPTAVTLTNTNQNSSCGQSNGSIAVTASGGTPAYTYNWGNNVTTQNRTGLTVGSYMVSVTDANRCVQSLTTTISSLTSATITPTSTNVTCFGGTNGSINISVTGGTAPFTYNWGNNVTTQSRTGLAAGVYTATVTDASNCSSVLSQTITQPQTALTATLSFTPISGSTLAILVATVSGGISPYGYLWNTGTTVNQITGSPNGTYSVTISDANNCQFSRSITFTTGLLEPFDNVKINVLPNPANNQIVLQTQELLKNSYKVKLYDITGKIVVSKDFLQGSTFCVIESSDLYEGLYILHVTDSISTQIFKVEVRH